MRFLHLSIRNFMIISKAEIPLADRGLVLILGNNHDSAAFDSNGAGKSSLFESLVYAQHGVTLRGLKADEILPKNHKKNCRVSLKFEDEDLGIQYEIIRYRKHKKYKNELLLKIDGEDKRGHSVDDTQKKINTILDIDLQTFSNSVLFGQGLTKKLKKFSEMTDVEQKDVLELILGIQELSEAAKIARSKAQERAYLYNEYDNEYEDKMDDLRKSSEEFKRLLEKHEHFEDSKKNSIWEVTRKWASALKAEELAWDKIPDVKFILSLIDTCEKERIQLDKDSTALVRESETLRDKVRPVLEKSHERLGELRADKKAANKIIGSMLRQGKGKCPKCRQQIDVKLLEEEREEQLGIISQVTESIFEIDSRVKAVQDDLHANLEEKSALAEGLLGKKEELTVTAQECRQQLQFVNAVRAEVSLHQKNILSYRKQIIDEKERQSGLGDILSSMSSGIKQQKKESMLLKYKSRLVSNDLAKYEFWVEAFGPAGIRSLILDSVTPFLNKKVNEYCEILTDNEITVEFVTQQTLKNGEIRDKFGVVPANKNGAESYKGNSGGERRRIDLAVILALGDLVASRSKKKFNILLLDEVLTELDQTGVNAVMRLLNVLSQKKESIFVITHIEGLQNQFEEVLTVDRRNGKAKVV